MEVVVRWTRRTWMTLAALSAMCAAAIVAAAALLMPAGRTADLLKAGASLQFMHSMATLACATVVQIGGARARHAPRFFLAAIVLLSGSIYAMAFGAPPAVWATVVAGMLSAATGWVILASGAAGVDVPAEARAVQPSAARSDIGRSAINSARRAAT